jgi:hypothetical protein
MKALELSDGRQPPLVLRHDGPVTSIVDATVLDRLLAGSR